jgi:hypothetical protein
MEKHINKYLVIGFDLKGNLLEIIYNLVDEDANGVGIANVFHAWCFWAMSKNTRGVGRRGKKPKHYSHALRRPIIRRIATQRLVLAQKEFFNISLKNISEYVILFYNKDGRREKPRKENENEKEIVNYSGSPDMRINIYHLRFTQGCG